MENLAEAGPQRNRLLTVSKPRSRAERPPDCRRCRRRCWWNGWRIVFPLVATAVATVVERWKLPLARAKCSVCLRAFTCYPEGFYPHRQYQLDPVAEVVAKGVLGEEPVAFLAGSLGAAVSSVRRWTRWIADLARPGDLLALASWLDPEAPTGEGLPTVDARDPISVRAAEVLGALEQVGAALGRRGWAAGVQTGLARLLGWQLSTQGVAVGLCLTLGTFSPAMVLGRDGADP